MSYYEHNGKIHVRYYKKNGEYLDHGRMIYEEVPKPGDAIAPFWGMHGPISWIVSEVKFPENDCCMEIYVEDGK